MTFIQQQDAQAQLIIQLALICSLNAHLHTGINVRTLTKKGPLGGAQIERCHFIIKISKQSAVRPLKTLTEFFG